MSLAIDRLLQSAATYQAGGRWLIPGRPPLVRTGARPYGVAIESVSTSAVKAWVGLGSTGGWAGGDAGVTEFPLRYGTDHSVLDVTVVTTPPGAFALIRRSL